MNSNNMNAEVLIYHMFGYILSFTITRAIKINIVILLLPKMIDIETILLETGYRIEIRMVI